MSEPPPSRTPWLFGGALAVTLLQLLRPEPEIAAPLDQAFEQPIAPPSASAPGPTLEPRLEERRVDLERTTDVRNLALARERHPPEGWSPLPDTRPGDFPGVPFAKVRAYTFGFAPVGGCDLVDPHDGALCDDVVLPGATLSPAQVERLLALLRKPVAPKDRPGTRCGFDPHHGFVFYDRDDRPVAEVLFCLLCAQWAATPGAPAIPSEAFGMFDAETDALGRLCDELGLPACWVREWGAVGDIGLALAELRGHPEDPRPPWQEGPRTTALELDPGVHLDALDAVERRKLCGWWVNVVSTGERHGPWSTVTCSDDRKVTYGPYAACLDRLGPASATVGELADCGAALVRDPCGDDARELCAAFDRPFGTTHD